MEQEKIEWVVLESTWKGLTAVMDQYESGGQGFATLCEARRLVETEMHLQGYKTEWATLTGGSGDDNG